MQTKQRFSLNWGKGATILTIVLVVTLLCFVALLSLSGGAGNSVAVDWGSSYSPDFAKPPVHTLAVDWGSLKAPCLPTDPKCGSGPVAVDWGDSYSPNSKPPVRAVAVNQSNKIVRL